MEELPKQIEKPESGSETERMVKCTKISTVFSNAGVLENIADKLMSEGIISGFSIEPVVAGYVYEGKKVEEGQFKLEILIGSESGQENKEKIISKIKEVIGAKWDVPAIQEQGVEVNEKFLSFIKRAEVEHKRYRKERKLKLTLAVAVLAAMSSIVGAMAKKYVDDREQKAVAESVLRERQISYEKVRNLEQKIQDQINKMNIKISRGEPFTPSPTDMAAGDLYEETDTIRDLVREVEFEADKLANPERYKDMK